tara:strand:+ start:240 stop:419 length:180 start_codon:yes stop_codon:yes gene_type:complete
MGFSDRITEDADWKDSIVAQVDTLKKQMAEVILKLANLEIESGSLKAPLPEKEREVDKL